MFKIFATPLVITIENGLVVSVRQNFAHKCCIVTDAASNARFLCEQVYLCSPDVIIEEHNGENIAWLLIGEHLNPFLFKQCDDIS
jgi:hypothetical protein